ncbi:MAG: ATP-binding protein [Anaerolineales bacterium]|nr:ATP-binding protein [Anaerolineales bacterium]
MLTQANHVKQLVILSGKGGTGKTSISAAIADLAHSSNKQTLSVMVDADVDAANLSLVLQPQKSEVHEFWGGSVAEIDKSKCIGCDLCELLCRFDAIFPYPDDTGTYFVDPIACDGCAACVFGCSQEAIRLIPQQDGNWFHSETRYGELFHAELFPGKENSGKLVTLIKQHARLRAEDTQASLLIVDGPPGIGCPVISACAGADLGLIVTEPSVAGIHDFQRILGVLQHFKIPAVVCINKTDIYPEGVEKIRQFSASQEVAILGEIPFDDHITQAMVQGKPITTPFPDAPSSRAILEIWEELFSRLT